MLEVKGIVLSFQIGGVTRLRYNILNPQPKAIFREQAIPACRKPKLIGFF
jgi:hypothetical protein